MLGFSKKKLLVSGCSFTASGRDAHEVVANELRLNRDKNNNLLYELPIHKKWPEIVADELNLELVNLARCGWGNEIILDSITKYILKNGHDDLEMVLIGLSDFKRECIDCWDFYQIKPETFTVKRNDKEKNLLHGKRPFPNKPRINIFKNLKNIFFLQEFLKNRGVKYKFFPLMQVESSMNISAICKQIIYYSTRDLGEKRTQRKVFEDEKIFREIKLIIFKELRKNIYFKNIDENNVYGWPLLKELGGHLLNFPSEHDVVSMIHRDIHPNKIGHQKIAKEVLKFL